MLSFPCPDKLPPLQQHTRGITPGDHTSGTPTCAQVSTTVPFQQRRNRSTAFLQYVNMHWHGHNSSRRAKLLDLTQIATKAESMVKLAGQRSTLLLLLVLSLADLEVEVRQAEVRHKAEQHDEAHHDEHDPAAPLVPAMQRAGRWRRFVLLRRSKGAVKVATT